MYMAQGPLRLWYFYCIFLPNKGENQKKRKKTKLYLPGFAASRIPQGQGPGIVPYGNSGLSRPLLM